MAPYSFRQRKVPHWSRAVYALFFTDLSFPSLIPKHRPTFQIHSPPSETLKTGIPKSIGTGRKIPGNCRISTETLGPGIAGNSFSNVQTRCIVKGEAQKSPLFWRFSGGFRFSQDRLFFRNSTRNPSNLIKSLIFYKHPL